MTRLLRIIPGIILALTLAGCRSFAPTPAASAVAPSLPSLATASALPTQAHQSMITATYLAVDRLVPSEVVKEYLVQKEGASAYGGKVFCAYQVMGTGQAGPVIQLYLWAFVQEYYVEQTVLKEGSASSLPVVLVLKMQAGKYQIIDFKDAGEGYQYLRVNFPAWILPRIQLPAAAYNLRVARLSDETHRAAGRYFGIK
jgi:hypothetical protein